MKNLNASSQSPIHVVGAGLAGTECALQLASRGHRVVLHEMRGSTLTPAHRTNKFAELVCSNSFGSLAAHAAPAQLKWEAELLGSFILKAAFLSQVPAGQALGMDREVFAGLLTEWVHSHPNIEVRTEVVTSLESIPRPTVIATGPLTHEPLGQAMRDLFGKDFLYFFDAIAPIIDTESINMNIAWRADRFDKGTKDYINCPLEKKDYFFFIESLQMAKKIEPKEFEKNTPYFEGCMPIEAMLSRGPQTLRFGPLSPKGLRNPRTGNNPYAVVQLRQENREATAYNMVGFQTKMAYGDQKQVFRLIPGLENAEFLKLGSMHRNLFIHTPKSLSKDLSLPQDPLLFFAGQITGVEGYFDSASIGLLVSHFVEQKMAGLKLKMPPRASAMGSLLNAITDETKDEFQPTNINFSLFPVVDIRDKTLRRQTQIDNAKAAFLNWLPELGLSQSTSNLKTNEASAKLLHQQIGEGDVAL